MTTPSTPLKTGPVDRGELTQVDFYRVGAVLIGLIWPLWLVQLALTCPGPEGVFGYWYTTVTFLLFCAAEAGLLVAGTVGHLHLLTGIHAGSFEGADGTRSCRWFAGMTGVPAVVVALTVTPRVATAASAMMQVVRVAGTLRGAETEQRRDATRLRVLMEQWDARSRGVPEITELLRRALPVVDAADSGSVSVRMGGVR